MQGVSLRRCAKLTDAGLAELALGGTLRSVCVAGVPRMGPAAMQALAASCRFAPPWVPTWGAILALPQLYPIRFEQ